jgi:hypothetical protein
MIYTQTQNVITLRHENIRSPGFESFVVNEYYLNRNQMRPKTQNKLQILNIFWPSNRNGLELTAT